MEQQIRLIEVVSLFRFLDNMDKKVKLIEGEEHCLRCEGTGWYPPERNFMSVIQHLCAFCKGRGKIDWITQMTRNRRL